MPVNLLTIPSRPASTEILQLAVMEATVSISGFCYVVDLGEGVQPRRHYVDTDLYCACELVQACPAAHAVQVYLQAGGQPAPQPPPGYYPIRPAFCPVCGAATCCEPKLSSKRRGIGWRCLAGGTAHYWEMMGRSLAIKFAANPWLFPPVVIRDGVQIFANDDVQNGDQVLYPGIRRSEVIVRP